MQLVFLSVYGISCEAIRSTTEYAAPPSNELDFHEAGQSKTDQTLKDIDSKLRSLQEKSQIWEILLHHMDALGDHISTVDRKLDSLNQNRDHFASLENRLINLEYLLRHYDDKRNTNDDAVPDGLAENVENIDQNVKGVKRAAVHRPLNFDWQKADGTGARTRDRAASRQTVLEYSRQDAKKLAGDAAAEKSTPARLELADYSGEKNEVDFEFIYFNFILNFLIEQFGGLGAICQIRNKMNSNNLHGTHCRPFRKGFK